MGRGANLFAGVMSLEKAKAVARDLGVGYTVSGYGGEVVFSFPNKTLRVNNRRKDAPRELLKMLRNLSKQSPDQDAVP